MTGGVMRTLRGLAAVIGLIVLLAGCSGGAVVFAPLPADPGEALFAYTHPGGVFALDAPPAWTVHTQTLPTLVSASFSPPGDPTPVLTVAVTRLTAPPTADALPAFIDRYQTQLRPDFDEYDEIDRALLPDGTWRMSGVRLLPAGRQPVNTFITLQGDHLLVIETPVPDDDRLRTTLTRMLATVRITDATVLSPADATALTALKPSALAVLHVRAWTANDGAFFITGEVANYGDQPAIGLPIEAALLDAAGGVAAGAVDAVMGAGIPPGGFAPFSLRFGAQPPAAVTYALTVGANWTPPVDAALLDGLTWTDSFRFDEFGRLVIEGVVTNTGAATGRELTASATLFDAAGGVIGAGFTRLPDALPAGDSAPYTIIMPHIGGSPANYLVTVTGAG